jgi:signal transduction histidine kinase
VKRDGETMRVVAINDISERKKSEEALRKSEKELREANATKDKFFSILAHDLRSPVSNLLQFAKLMEENYDIITKEEEGEYIKSLVKIADGTYNLLENLLTWSRIQLDKISVIPEDFNLRGIIDSAVKLCEEDLKRKNLKLEVSVEKNLHPYANQESVYFVIRNLLSNAVKFTPNGGKVTITASVYNDNHEDRNIIEICVKDTGVGIPKERVEALFNMDAAFSTEGTENEQGTGLGLILCKEFVERNGGRINVYSKLGKGSSFCFTIPSWG